MTSDPAAPLWRDTAAETFRAPPLDADAGADLAIVGGGFTGTAAALAAAEAGARAVLVEAETVGHGGSGRNVGLVNAGLWLPPDEVIAALGDAAGLRLLSALAEGPETVFRLIARHAIACEPRREGTLHLAHAPAGLADLGRRHAQGVRLGAPLALLDAGETARRTGSRAFAGALFDPRAGTVQPLAYVRGLARAAAAAGARICEGTRLAGLSRQGDDWLLTTAAGPRLRARAVLFATNAYHAGIAGGFRPDFVPMSYCQFATRPLPADLRARILPGGEGCWDTALVMSSFRLDAAGRMIVGGLGDVEGYGAPVHRSWARRKLAAVYPDLAGIGFEHAWRGRIAMTSDHVPKVVAFGPRALAVFGYSGRGIAPGTVFGTAAARALLHDQPGALPLPVLPGHHETLPALRAAGYEAGAVLAHALPVG